MELPFQVGKTLLADFLNGDYKNKSITKNNLDELYNFDSLHWGKEEIYQEIDKLIINGMIELSTSDYNKFVKILKLTMKGQNEIVHPTLSKKELKNKIKFKQTKVTEEDLKRFEALKSFLEKYNNEQKKTIISEAEKILCVAGAGSGKTTVLTKRIEFLVKYRNVPPEKILAITFTRKARQEMEKRLYKLNVDNRVKVHTFNSFCEGILRKHSNQIYDRHVRVQSYSDKILAMNMALGTLGIDMEDALQSYFTPQQRKFKTGNQLANSFMNDCFSVMDYFKVAGKKGYDFSKDVDVKNRHNARRVYQITEYLKKHMETQGLRDYTDQILDATKFLKENVSEIPSFEHVLIDEYQDVNAMQVNLINLLKPKNLFAVGDPRQSIFGWRGADINYILNFEKDYGDSEVIHLTKNYRSTKEIVDFINHSIKSMGLPDLEHHQESRDTKIKIINFESEEAERKFVVRKILESKIAMDEIFVLVRTNRQLQELSKDMKNVKISHIVKTDEVQSPAEGTVGGITLATVHAIKGLEAKKVFVVGCNEQNFPCKASDHPAIEMIKIEDYNKLEEEKRLFYVAISRTKEILYLTYSGKKRTYFISDEMANMVEDEALPKQEGLDLTNHKILEELTIWRNILSRENNAPAYTIINNKTIELIAQGLPSTAEALSKIDGIGPSKLINYGAKILEIVREK
ncbi:ATP-dependent DNA helicase UvrD2, partial [Candidatus Pacearchaeota archaeon]|nr:ATP-dependent DNA helicase UvrD2 [Candidatus Pacearchaeota archaeon]